jgi:hypothetical protein
MKGTRFEAVPSTQQTLTRELKAVGEELFSGAFDSLYEWCYCYAEASEEYILSTDNNKKIHLFVWFLWLKFGDLIVILSTADKLFENVTELKYFATTELREQQIRATLVVIQFIIFFLSSITWRRKLKIHIKT